MTIPAVFFGILVSTFIGAAFHLWKDGGVGRLVLYVLLSWVGFWAGHVAGLILNWPFFSVGPLYFGMALLGCILVLGVGYWLSLVRQPN